MSGTPVPAPIEVLLVEDSEDDTVLAIRALERAKLRNHIHVLTNGAHVLPYLRRQGDFATALRPDLILLDLHLPVRDGRHVLAEVKNDESLRDIPIIVVTGSEVAASAAQDHPLPADAYVSKPISAAALLRAVNSIGQFWLQIVRVP